MTVDIKFSDNYKKAVTSNIKRLSFSCVFLLVIIGKNLKKSSLGFFFKTEVLLLILLLLVILSSIITFLKLKSRCKNYITITDKYIEIDRNIIRSKKISLDKIQDIKLRNDSLIIYYDDYFEYSIDVKKLSKEDVKIIQEINA